MYSIKFYFVETDLVFGSNLHVICKRETCDQCSSKGGQRREIAFDARNLHQICTEIEMLALGVCILQQ